MPIIRIGPTLLVSLRGNLEDESVLAVEEALTKEVERTGSQGVLIDISGLVMVDSFIARVVARIVSMVRLLGSDAVVVGMPPIVAITLVELGLDLEGVHTALDVERGLRILEHRRTDDREFDHALLG